MSQTFNSIIQFLDLIRVQLLKLLLNFSLFKKLYLTRSNRLFTLFLIACLIYLPLSIYFPVWVVLIGPAIWGLPHIISSIRYVTSNSLTANQNKSPTSQNIFFGTKFKKEVHFFLIAWAFVAAIRVVTSLHWIELNEVFFSHEIELGFFLMTLIYFWWTSKRNLISFIQSTIFAATLCALALYVPSQFIASLMIIHNFIAFYYWIQISQNSKDQKIAIASTIIFSVISAYLLFGNLNFFYQWISPIKSIPAFGFDFSQISEQLAPWTEDQKVWWNFFVTYTFGQALHYFVWLKAIPEQKLKVQNPISFNQSWKNLVNHFGLFLSKTLVILCLVSLIIWFIIPLPEARMIYLAIASYHGFHELAGIIVHRLRSTT